MKPRESITLLRLGGLPWIVRGSSSSWAKMMVEINKRRKGRTVHLHLRVVGIHLVLVGILIEINRSSATTDEVVRRRIKRLLLLLLCCVCIRRRRRMAGHHPGECSFGGCCIHIVHISGWVSIGRACNIFLVKDERVSFLCGARLAKMKQLFRQRAFVPRL